MNRNQKITVVFSALLILLMAGNAFAGYFDYHTWWVSGYTYGSKTFPTRCDGKIRIDVMFYWPQTGVHALNCEIYYKDGSSWVLAARYGRDINYGYTYWAWGSHELYGSRVSYGGIYGGNDINGYGGNTYYFLYFYFDPPSHLKGKKIEFKSVQRTHWDYYVATYKTGESYGPDAPYGVTASQNEFYDKVRVNWQKPNTGGNSYYYYVYRDNTYIGSTSNNYMDDYSASPGASHRYKVRTYLTCGNLSQESSEATGRRFRATPPTNLAASKDAYCDRVKLTWTAPSLGSFQNQSWYTQIYRSDGKTFNVEKRTSYEDKSADRGKIYTYKLRTVFTSGGTQYSDYTSAVEGRVAEYIAAPTNIQPSNQFCNKVELKWDWKSDDPEAFGILQSQSIPKSLYFDRINRDYVVTVPISNLQMTYHDYTIETWFKITGNFGYSEIPLVSNNQSGWRQMLRLSVINKKLYADFGGYGFYGGTALEQDKWYHVAFVYHYSGYRAYIYLNGKQDGYNSYMPYCYGGGNLELGRRENYYLEGCLDDVRVWNSARSSSDIIANMNKKLAGNESGLTGYWSFDAGATKDSPFTQYNTTSDASIAPIGSVLDIDGGTRTFTFTDLSPNQKYYFSLMAKDACNTWGHISEPKEGKTSLDIGVPKNLMVSKGYHSDRVELKWECDGYVDRFKIWRSVAGENKPIHIVTLDGGNYGYDDKSAVPGVIYEYTVKGERNCEQTSLSSDPDIAMGFREAAGIVTGHVEFEGGNAVEDVEVFVEPTIGTCLNFDGVNDYIAIPANVFINVDRELSVELWTKGTGDLSKESKLFEAVNSQNMPVLRASFRNNAITWAAGYSGSLDAVSKQLDDSYKKSEWNHWTFVKDVNAGEMKIYLNGKLWLNETGKKNIITGITTMRLCTGAGGGSFWAGSIDEIRVWGRVRKMREVERDYRRMLIGDEEKLLAYWRLDENVGSKLFDRSKTVASGTTTYHGNDADISGASWSKEVPAVADLHLSGYTDANGNYEIRGIRYVGDGQTYTITPNFGVHKFQPGSRSAFISANSSVINGVDFLDISTFEVRGKVKYENTSCFAKEIFILVDGEHTNPPTKTDQNGEFVMNIPIGRHRVAAFAPNHEFSPGLWPTADQPPHNFIQPISIPDFIDVTRPKVIGRVVGGWREAEAFPGKHKNNLGQATLTFESQNGCLKRSYVTDAETGGFAISDLPPLKYNTIIEMKNGVGQTVYNFDAEVLDMSINAPLTTLGDTSVVSKNQYGLSADQTGAVAEINNAVDIGEEWTLEAWFKYPLSSTESWNTLFGGANTDKQAVVKRSQSKLGFYNASTGEFVDCGYNVSKLTTGWHHIAVVAKKTENRQYYYIDGALSGSVDGKSTSDIKTIGNSMLSSEAWGTIDEVRVWNFARTQLEIQEDMNAALTGAEKGLQAYYRFETASGQTIADSTANNRSATLKSNAVLVATKELNVYPVGSTVNYNYQFDFIYNSTPQMDFAGLPVVDSCKTLAFPLFQQHNKYGIRIKLFEEYINYDKPLGAEGRVDNVPVKEAMLTVNNDIGDEAEKQIQLNNGLNPDTGARYPLGDTLFTFKAGYPNFLTDATNPQFSYTKTFDVAASLKNGQSASKLIRGYVIGAKARENNFITRGPERVEMILRDPPGSGSTAFKSEGSTHSYSTSMEINSELGLSMENSISLGPDFIAGFGVMTEVDVTLDFTQSTEMTFSNTSYFELDKTVTFNKTFTTNENAELVGSSSDMFIGGSENYLYGMTDILRLNNACELEKTAGMYLVPKGFATTFIYTADHIRNYLIPDLIMLRDNMFSRQEYVSHVHPDTSMYGSNNDDPRWGSLKTSNTPEITEVNKDLDGPSYTFTPPTGYTGLADSIRWYNQQIRLWNETLTLNDSLKANAVFVENISFDANANYDQDVTVELTQNYSQSFEISVANSFGIAIGVENAGMGAETSLGLSVSTTVGASASLTNVKSVTTGFSLRDSDEGDYLSVDILNDPVFGTPVFKTVAGQTMCPWEGPSYWIKDPNVDPGDSPNNMIISSGTMHREVPVLKVYPTVVENVPTDEPAVFNLQLGNASETDEGMLYYLRVLQETNPYGAVVAVNGVIIENFMEYSLDAGQTLNATMTIRRGPERFEYEGIKMILYSPCEYELGGNGGEFQAVDTVSVTARFIRDCTPVSIYTPIENWVVNSFNKNTAGKDTMLVKLVGYDIHDLYLDNLKIQYRPLDGNIWYTVEKFTKASWLPFAWDPTTYTSQEEPPYIPGNFPTKVDSLPDGYVLPLNEPYILYSWDVTDLPDKEYQLRAISNCELVENKSEPLVGILDRMKPHAFGTPEPTDGVLSSGEDIILTLNENIHSSPGMLTFDNFDIRGILNGTKIDHSTSLHFDGTDDYATVADNYTLDISNLSIEAWVNTKSTGGWQTIVMKGNYGYGLAIDENMKLRFWNQSTKENTAASEGAVPEDTWTHVAFTTDGAAGTYYINGAPVGTTSKCQILNNNGDLYVGRSGEAGNVDNFKGFIHELRVWNILQDRTHIASKMGRLLNGSEAGLIGYYQMNEGLGDLLEDRATDHHAKIAEATWKVYPIGKSIELAGNEEVEAELYETSLENYTVEFWYRPATAANVPVFQITGAGEHRMLFQINGANLECDFNHKLGTDRGNLTAPISANTWQHIALTWNGYQGKLYKNGELTFETSDSLIFDYFHKITIGDSTFTGAFDEVRLWKLTRTQSQIQRYYTHRLTGQEPGLVGYYPFEKHNAQLIAETTLLDLSSYWGYESTDNNGCGCWKWIENKNHATGPDDLAFVDGTPPIQIPRPVQPVSFEWSVRENQIYINLLTPDSLIEHCQLDITVSNLKDLNGNIQASPVTWDVYVDRNPLEWLAQSVNEIKNIDEAYSFSAKVHNRSGVAQSFQIVNLPDWLTATPSEGSVKPLEDANITFNVHPGLNTGSYASSAYIHSDFGFEQRLPISIRVLTPPPSWSVDKANFENSMNVTARVSINGVDSHDAFDMIAAFVGDECRGAANMRYERNVDKYLGFVTIYSNATSGETINFRVWNSGNGVEHNQVTPQLTFTADAINGTLEAPLAVSASGDVIQRMTLPKGWMWMSFNKAADNMSTTEILKTLSPVDNDQIKSQTQFAQYSAGSWNGSLAAIENEKMYMMKLASGDTLEYSGDILLPSAKKVAYATGWNWIGFIPNMNIEINEALANVKAATGDLIKSQDSYAMYSENFGWAGNLLFLKPGQGYKLYTANSGEFVYPDEGMYLPSPNLAKETTLPKEIANWRFEAGEFEHNMTLTATVDAQLGDQSETGYIAAFFGDQCRGVAKPVYVEKLKKYIYFLMIHSNKTEREALELRIFRNAEEGERIITEKIQFKSDEILGTLAKQMELQSRELRAGDRGFIPKEFILSQNFPNPFNPVTKIGFGVPKTAHVTIKIYNIMGQEVITLFDEQMEAGYRYVEWNSTNDNGISMASGMYFIKMISGDFVKTRKMTLLK